MTTVQKVYFTGGCEGVAIYFGRSVVCLVCEALVGEGGA